MMKPQSVLLTLLALGLAPAAAARVPTQLDAQGVLRDGAGDLVDLPDATIVFRMYDAATAGNLVWSETQTLPVVLGVFDALLPASALTELPTAVQTRLATGAPLWLSVQLAGQAELPRTPLVSVPYAFTADRALSANDLVCSGCIDASDINGSTFTAQNLVYAPASGDLVTATTVGGAIGQLDHDLADHIANPNGHHPADSSGIAIKPTSVTIGATTLTDGTLDLGAGAHDALTAAQVATLTAGGNADALHQHTAAAISGLSGGATCYTMWGGTACASGYLEVYAGTALTPLGHNGTSANGAGSTICAQGVTLYNTSGVGSIWFDGGSYYSGSRIACRTCCTDPAAATQVSTCTTSADFERAVAGYGDFAGSTNYQTNTISPTTAAFSIGPKNRTYHFTRIEVGVPTGYGGGTTVWPTASGAVTSQNLQILASDGTTVLAQAPLVRNARSFTVQGFRGSGGSTVTVYVYEAKLDWTYTGDAPVRLRAWNISLATPAAQAGLFIDDRYNTSCSGATCEGLPYYHIYGCLE